MNDHARCHGYHPHHGRRFARGGPDFHPFGGRGRHSRSGLPRFLGSNDLRLVLLLLIAEKPRHGYELMKALEERSAGAYSPSPGVIYPTLTLLEELGHVTTAAAEGGRKLHQVTPEGLVHLEANRADAEALLARLEEAGRLQGGVPPAPLLRAMENLKLSLRLRLARGPLDDAQAQVIAAALDAAAIAVERS